MTYEEKLKEIVDHFKTNKEELISHKWADGSSVEYEYAGLTYIEVNKDKQINMKEYAVLKDYNGEEIAEISHDGTTSIESSFDDELEMLDKAYEDFTETKKDDQRLSEKVKVEPKENKNKKRSNGLR